MRRIALAFALLSAAACSSSHKSSSTDTCGAGIVNGYCLAATSELGSSTVMVMEESNDLKIAVCSGTLIDRRLILTAQHCAQDMRAMAVIFSDHALNAQNEPNGPYIKVDTVKVYGPTVDSEHDLAILHLESDAPSNYSVRSLPPAYFNINYVDSFTEVGYGITSENKDDSGYLRSTTVPQSALITHVDVVEGGMMETETAGSLIMLSSPTTGVCHGDSGGPLYANQNGTSQIIGVAEAVATTDGNEDHQCHGVSVFVDIRQNLDWIRQAMGQLLQQ